MQITNDMVERVLDTLYPHWRKNSNGAQDGDRHIARLALELALSAPPPPNTVPVRVAVAFDADGVNWAVESIEDYRNDEAAWVFLSERRGFPIRSCIATIPAPLPAVPEVAGVVETGVE